MTVTMHTCRGNFKSSWVASGGYEPVAEAMFSSAVDAFFMEFDSERAGGFEPLRYLPKGKKVVLGLMTSKSPVLEEKDFIKKRIEEAAKYRAAGKPLPVAAVRLLQHAPRQQPHRGRAVAQARARRRGRARGLALKLAWPPRSPSRIRTSIRCASPRAPRRWWRACSLADGTAGFGFTLNLDAGVARDMAAWDALGRAKGVPLYGLAWGFLQKKNKSR